MKNRWDAKKAKAFANDVLAMRVYTSQLLGQDENLVLHGGGNTSVKKKESSLFGDNEILYVKGSGWDLATIRPEGFAPIKLRELLTLLEQPSLSDSDMVRYQRQLLTNPYAPNPSIEALLHALIPFRYVDHTHADAVLALTNTPRGEQWVRQVFGDRVLIIPYVKPGFDLAKEVYRRTRGFHWKNCEGMILMNHGVFTFDNDAKKSYSRMINMVSQAERFLQKKKSKKQPSAKVVPVDLIGLAQIRKHVSEKQKKPLIALSNLSPDHVAFSQSKAMLTQVVRGPITPDHVIRTKAAPVCLGSNPAKDIDAYEKSYNATFDRFATKNMTRLDSAPRWAVWSGHGTLSFGVSYQEARVVADIVKHAVSVIPMTSMLGGWRPLSTEELFEIEYWELEQAKLKKTAVTPAFQGQIALVSGAASGIGKACVESLRKKGAAVVALDVNPAVEKIFSGQDVVGLHCDMTRSDQVERAVKFTVERFGGLDFVVSNAGIFPPSRTISHMDERTWERSLEINLTSHRLLVQACVPFLEWGVHPSIVIVGSKNVPAPGPGMSAYSVAKAGLTQLARVASLELGPKGIRVNVIHPNAVYDTGIWNENILKTRAKNYGISVEKYKTNNVLGVTITSADVAEMVSALLGPAFSKTTGAQIPLDGGNERVI